MSGRDFFDINKSITDSYVEGMKQGGLATLPALERAIAEIHKHNPNVAIDVLEKEIRRIKGLPF